MPVKKEKDRLKSTILGGRDHCQASGTSQAGCSTGYCLPFSGHNPAMDPIIYRMACNQYIKKT